MFERIDTICLTVSNLPESSTWYQQLGFTINYKGDNYQVLTVGNSEVPLTLEEGSNLVKENQAYPIFFTKDIQHTYRELQEKGVLVTGIQDDGDNRFFDFYDRDNNKLQVCFWE